MSFSVVAAIGLALIAFGLWVWLGVEGGADRLLAQPPLSVSGRSDPQEPAERPSIEGTNERQEAESARTPRPGPKKGAPFEKLRAEVGVYLGLRKPGVIARVVDELGSPFADCALDVLVAADSRPRTREARTDVLGYTTLPIRPDEFDSDHAVKIVARAAVGEPKMSAWRTLRALDRDHQASDVDLGDVVLLDGRLWFEGQLVDTAGNPVSFDDIWLTEAPRIFAERGSDKGRFCIRHFPGDPEYAAGYSLQARARFDKRYANPSPLHATGGSFDLRYVLEEAHSLVGIVLADEVPLGGVRIRLRSAREPSREPLTTRGRQTQSDTADVRYEFAFDQLSSSPYDLEVVLEGFPDAPLVQLWELPTTPSKSSVPGAPLEIRLSLRSLAHVSVHDESGKPIAANVTAWPTGSARPGGSGSGKTGYVASYYAPGSYYNEIIPYPAFDLEVESTGYQPFRATGRSGDQYIRLVRPPQVQFDQGTTVLRLR